MNENHQITLQQIQNQNTWIQHLKTVINQFNARPLHTSSNPHILVWKTSDLKKFNDKLLYLNWKTEMINKIQLNYNQKKESEEIKKYIFSHTIKVLQN